MDDIQCFVIDMLRIAQLLAMDSMGHIHLWLLIHGLLCGNAGPNNQM